MSENTVSTEVANGINIVRDHWSHREGKMLWRCAVTIEANGDLYSYTGVTARLATDTTIRELQKVRDELDIRISQLKGISHD